MKTVDPRGSVSSNLTLCAQFKTKRFPRSRYLYWFLIFTLFYPSVDRAEISYLYTFSFCRQEDIKLLRLFSASENENMRRKNGKAGLVSSTHAFEKIKTRRFAEMALRRYFEFEKMERLYLMDNTLLL